MQKRNRHPEHAETALFRRRHSPRNLVAAESLKTVPLGCKPGGTVDKQTASKRASARSDAVSSANARYTGFEAKTVSFPRRLEFRLKYTAPYTPQITAIPTAISGSFALPRPSSGPMM